MKRICAFWRDKIKRKRRKSKTDVIGADDND